MIASFKIAVSLLLATLCITGCRYIVSEPLPAFITHTIKTNELPRKVVQGFRTDWPNATVQKVESSSFKGRAVEFRMTLATADGGQQTVIYDEDGRPVPPPGLFRPPPAQPR